jgi:hypothetical protein
MSDYQIIANGAAGLNVSIDVQAQDPEGNPHPATGTARIDRYGLAFIAELPPVYCPSSGEFGRSMGFQILPRAAMIPGQPTQTVNVTFDATDTASGAALFRLVFSVDLIAPPPAPGQLATRLVISAGPSSGTGSTATDPGSATIPISLD